MNCETQVDASDLLTTALVLITGIYAWLTYRIARSNERSAATMARQTDILTRPFVEVGVLLPKKIPIFLLRVRNTGRTPARNLRLSIDRPFFSYGERTGTNLAEVNAFREAIPAFGPGAELMFELAQASVVFGKEADPSLTPPEFNVTASYQYECGVVSETFHIDLKPYLNSSMGFSPLLEELERIRKALEKKN